VWRVRTAAFAAGPNRAMFAAEAGERWVGCASVIVDDGRPPELIAVWDELALDLIS
jgi:hypothetical protein